MQCDQCAKIGAGAGCSNCPSGMSAEARDERERERQRMDKRTVVKFGGHSTVIKGMSVSDVAHAIWEAEISEDRFVYIQGTQFGDNGIAIVPEKVEAIYADLR